LPRRRAVQLAPDRWPVRSELDRRRHHRRDHHGRGRERGHRPLPHRSRRGLTRLLTAEQALRTMPKRNARLPRRAFRFSPTPARRAPMSQITEAVDVRVPVRTAYDQWTQFETFPKFMEGVKSVRQLDDTTVHWVAEIAGREKSWDAKITE